ncbi:MAG: SDR family oxidoreductase [Acidobacteria bacterium]|nr:SDR family oxidoreductase [Acidobacteriota bacterium]MBI3655702.1 SDR family oxidoreductase [Acidobacteriota bacterium]
MSIFNLQDKVVIITGGATGIGYSTAQLFARQGARLVVAGRRADACAVAVARLQALTEALAAPTDVQSEASVRQMVAAALARFGRLDILINNAGAIHRIDIPSATTDDWDRLVNPILRGTFYCCKHALPALLASGAGRIVNISSYLGWHGGQAGATAIYAAAKAGVIGLTKSMAVRYGPDNLRVNAICPALIPTDLNPDLFKGYPDREARARELAGGYPLRRLGTPEDVAYAALFLASDESQWITGATLFVDGGLTAK